MLKNYLLFCLFIVCLAIPVLAKPLYVVTSFSDYAAIVKQIGGDLVEVEYLSHGDQDPHFVPPKPSLVLKLRKADLLVTTGLDLEMWMTTLQDKARNKNIMDGAKGYVTVYTGLELLQKPGTALSRTEGDIHIYGNPHIHTSPFNWKVISENILIGLQKVDPQNAAVYEANQQDFIKRVDVSMFGEPLVELIGGEQLEQLLKAGTLFEFLDKDYEGEKLINKLGGWLAKAMPLRGKEVIAYHKNWAYFARDFGIRVAGYIEVKPGIPPTPKHVEQTINLIKNRGIDVLMVANYFEKRKPETISQKTGIRAVFLPLSVNGAERTEDNFKLVDHWIDELLKAVANK